MNKVKPNRDFFEAIVSEMQCEANEILFLDDRTNNVFGAQNVGFHTIKVEKEMNIYDEIIRWMEDNERDE